MTESQPLVGYEVNMPEGAPPPKQHGALYNYTLAGNGLFIRAARPGLKVLVPVVECEVRGLAPLDPFVEMEYPRVPLGYLRKILDLSRSACVAQGSPIEALFHLRWHEHEKRWRLDKPKQDAKAASVRPLEDGEGSSYERALIEVHSHHNMTAFFSADDDADEQGFRIYGVIGEIFGDTPRFRVRAGCYGHFYELPAGDIFEVPEGIEDAND